MKLIVQILFIAVAGFILELFLPWWSISLAAFAGGLFVRSSSNFAAGFIAIALLWLLKALVIEMYAATMLAEKVAHIFMLPGKLWLIIVMSFIGGLVGGFSALTGSLVEFKK